jgi:hypothetical protein
MLLPRLHRSRSYLASGRLGKMWTAPLNPRRAWRAVLLCRLGLRFACRRGLRFGTTLAPFRGLGPLGPLGRGRGSETGSLGHFKPKQGGDIVMVEHFRSMGRRFR